MGALFASAALMGGCASNADPQSAGHRAPIIDGVPHDGDPSTVMLGVDGEFGCSGSIIHASAVLTARHCVEDPESGQPTPASSIDIRSGPAFEGAQTIAGVVDYVTTQGELDGQDIAVLLLDRPVTLTPYQWQRDGALADGTAIVGIGYGLTSPPTGPNQEPVRKHRGTSAVERSTQTEFFTTTSISCYGDSGGPAFDPAGVIIGVVSRGTDEECREQSIYTRTDAFRTLIEGALARAGTGATTPPGTSPPGTSPTPPGTTPPGTAPPGTAPPGAQPTRGDRDGDYCPDEIDESPDRYDEYPYDAWGYPCLEESDPWDYDPYGW